MHKYTNKYTNKYCGAVCKTYSNLMVIKLIDWLTSLLWLFKNNRPDSTNSVLRNNCSAIVLKQWKHMCRRSFLSKHAGLQVTMSIFKSIFLKLWPYFQKSYSSVKASCQWDTSRESPIEHLSVIVSVFCVSCELETPNLPGFLNTFICVHPRMIIE